MAASKERAKASRRKILQSNKVTLIEPDQEMREELVKEKIKVAKPKRKSALVEGDGQSMGMDMD